MESMRKMNHNCGHCASCCRKRILHTCNTHLVVHKAFHHRYRTLTGRYWRDFQTPHQPVTIRSTFKYMKEWKYQQYPAANDLRVYALYNIMLKYDRAPYIFRTKYCEQQGILLCMSSTNIHQHSIILYDMKGE